MKHLFKLTVTDFFKFSNGQTCLIGDVEPINQRVITSDFIAKIIIDNTEERPLNILGQDIFSRSVKTERNSKTVIRTTDNIDDIIDIIGKKKVVVTGYLPD